MLFYASQSGRYSLGILQSALEKELGLQTENFICMSIADGEG